jgi:hypothetical protein
VTTTIFIPISRAEHLQRLFHALEMLDCVPEATGLLTYVDGLADLFVTARNLTEASRFAQRLCVQRPQTDRVLRLFDISSRRNRIADIQNEAKQYLQGCDLIFGVEDDTVPPPHALRQLLHDYAVHPHAGFIEGVELGRWGIPYVGAWRADDIYEPTKFESAMPPTPGETFQPADVIQEIDAGGFYCYLTRAQTFLAHHHAPFGDALGPDVAYGLALRQQGFMNYIDWSVRCAHHKQDGEPVTLSNTPPPSRGERAGPGRGRGRAGHV